MLELGNKSIFIQFITKNEDGDVALRIGLDLDGVICDYYSELLHNLRSEVNPNISLDDLNKYNIAEVFGWSESEAEEFFSRDFERETFLKIKPICGALETISLLKKRGHEIYIITSRNFLHSEHTLKWAASYNLQCTALLFHKNKAPAAEKLGIELFVDDDPSQIERMKFNGINCLIYDQPVNRDYSDARRVCSWNEILNYIEEKRCTNRYIRYRGSTNTTNRNAANRDVTNRNVTNRNAANRDTTNRNVTNRIHKKRCSHYKA